MINSNIVIVYLGLTTLNTIVDNVFEDPHPLLYGMIPFRILVFATIFGYFRKEDDSAKTSTLLLKRMLYSVPLLSNALYFFYKAPHNWESNLWGSFVDLVVVTCIWTSDNCCLKDAQDLVLFFFANFYTAAGFWKINTHFLDPTASCATVFLAQHIAQYGPFLFRLFMRNQDIDDEKEQEYLYGLAKSMAPYGPVMTIVVELSMGLGLLFAWCLPNDSAVRSRVLRVALWIVLGFHFAVCITPQPHNICMFAAQCACRLSFVVPADDYCSAWPRIGDCLAKYWVWWSSFCFIVVAYGVQNFDHPQDWACTIFLFASAFIIVAMEFVEGLSNQLECKVRRKSPRWMLLARSFAIFYSFGTIVLGLMEEATPNMFANLKIHGGSNHLLLPTGLLFHYFDQKQPSSSVGARLWGGGEIRLTRTTSNWLTEIYPNDMTHVLHPVPLASRLLQQLDTAPLASYFNSGANRVLGLRAKGWVPPPPHDEFIGYTVPALEWRRLLREAMEKDRDFSLEYVHLEGTSGDENWRAKSWSKKVRLNVASGRIKDCQVERSNNNSTTRTKSHRCGIEELPYQVDTVPWWLTKVSLYHGYPVLFDKDGTPRKSIACFGP